MQYPVGRWVYGIDVEVGLPIFSEENYPNPHAAVKGAIQKLGWDVYKFRITVGRLAKPKAPKVKASRLLVYLYKDTYENVEAVLYKPSVDTSDEATRKWRQSVQLQELEDRVHAVLKDWLNSGNEMSWLEVVDEQEITKDDLALALEELRGRFA